MNGYIVADEDAWIYRFFGYQVCSPKDIRRALADNPPGETLTVEVNSSGGSMFAGFEIYSVLRGAPCPTEAEIQSLSASASSTAIPAVGPPNGGHRPGAAYSGLTAGGGWAWPA